MAAGHKRAIHRSKGQSGAGAAKVPAIGAKVKHGRKRK